MLKDADLRGTNSEIESFFAVPELALRLTSSCDINDRDQQRGPRSHDDGVHADLDRKLGTIVTQPAQLHPVSHRTGM